MPLSVRDIEPVLALWHEADGAAVSLLNHSENQTFRLDRNGIPSFTLRVHRPLYQSRASIESELAWLAALRRDTDLPTPEPVTGRNGQVLQHFVDGAGQERLAVLFRFIAGDEPRPDGDLRPLFATLGDYAARLHGHAEQWQRPAGFLRQSWGAATILDVDGLWGDWRMAPAVTPTIRSVLDRLDSTLWMRLAAYGTGPDRFGLIHADMRLGNLLVDGDHVTLIDFDDCGFSWFAYDFAAAISFHETSAAIPALKAAWLDRYCRVRPLAADDLCALDAMVMLRRMALLAWIGSHGETALARQHAGGFAEGTAALAERFLRGALYPGS